MPELTPNARRLAAEHLRNQLPQGVPHGYVTTGTVATVTAGAAADGNALVTVTVDGATQEAAYLASWTPTAAHIVAVLIQGGVLTILGRVIGTPPS